MIGLEKQSRWNIYIYICEQISRMYLWQPVTVAKCYIWLPADISYCFDVPASLLNWMSKYGRTTYTVLCIIEHPP